MENLGDNLGVESNRRGRIRLRIWVDPNCRRHRYRRPNRTSLAPSSSSDSTPRRRRHNHRPRPRHRWRDQRRGQRLGHRRQRGIRRWPEPKGAADDRHRLRLRRRVRA